MKIVEGTVANVPPHGGRKHPQAEFIPIDTSNILFICGGAFDGIEKVIEQRVSTSSMGFEADVKDPSGNKKTELTKQVTSHDLVKFGIIPELVGRIPIVTVLEELDEEAMCRILVEPKNSIIKQYKRIMEMDNVDLKFTDDALREIARETLKQNSGARGLRSVLEKLLIPVMYDVSSRNDVKTVLFDLDAVQTGTPKLS